jgi:hypothetical protein
MSYLGLLGFFLAILAYSELQPLKKRIAALEAAREGGPSA